MSALTTHPFLAVDRDNPWPGLAAFTEDQRGFFFGREKETEELVRLIRRQTLTVLFGQSGLGKSSLLQAGVFPRLREYDYLPLYLRLDHTPDSPPLVEQVKHALTSAFGANGAEAPEFRASETLWEYFHRKDTDIWSAKNRLLTPVLAFDQFEEIFTLGRADDTRRARGAAFLSELADLVENRAPAALRARFDAGELDPSRYNFDKPSCQVVLTLREDFLPDLEGLKTEMRSILTNRMRIRRLTGAQALEIVQKPAPHLLAEGVAERIVEFVAGARGGSAERLLEMEVEPALLSVICRELNERRRALGQAQITTDLVTGNRREILNDFYERSVADLPPAMREFVEDHLLTKSGFRDNFALETALETPGVTRDLIDTLVSHRLLRIEEHLGVPRVELAHDVLAEVVRASRDERQQRAALREVRRRALQLRGIAAGLTVLLAGATWVAWRAVEARRTEAQARRAEAAQSSRTDFVIGSRMLADGKVSEGLAYLVRAGRSDPENNAVGPRLLSALAYRSFALPVGDPLEHSATVGWVGYSKDGRRCLTRVGRSVFHHWDLASGKLLQTIDLGDLGMEPSAGDMSPDNRRFALGGTDGTVRVWDLETGRLMVGPLRHSQRVATVRFSPDGRWLGTGSYDYTAKLWDSTTGDLKATFSHQYTAAVVAFSPDSSRVLTWTMRGEWRIWTVPDGTPVIESIKGTPTSINKSSAFSADGKLVVIADSPTSMRFYDAATGAAVGPKMEHDLQIYSSAFSGDGKKLATVSTDQTARLWEVPSGKALLSPLEHEEPVSDVRFTSDGRHLVTSSSEGTTRVWDVATGRLAIEPLRRRFRDLAPNRGELMTFDGNMVRRWDAAPSAVAPTPFPSVAGRLRVQRDPKMQTAWALFSNQIQEMDVLNGRPLGAPRAFPVRTNQQFLLPGARHLGVITELGDTELWDLRSPNIVRHPLGRYKIRTLGFSSDSSHFAIAYDESHVQVWDTASGKPVGGPLKHESGANGIAFSPDRSLLAVACADYKAVVWELASGKRVGNLTMQQGTVVAVEFSPDGRLIATGCLGGTAQLWDAGTTQPVGPLHRLRGRVGTVAFSRDSRRLLTSALWETRVWDAATGAPLTDPMLQPYATKDPLVGAVFSEDETLIATYSRTGEVRIWDSASGLLVVEPIKFGKTIISLNFFSSDRFLTASHPLGGFSVWTIPPCAAGTRMPDWLMRLATALAGGEIDSRAIFRTRPFNVDVFEGIRKELAAAPLEGPFVEWGRWFLADRATRPVGPGLKITPAEAMALAGPDPLLAMKNRANVLKDEGNYAEAEPLFRQALAQEIVLHGESSMTVADRRAGLSQTLVALGKFEEAEELARASLKIRAQLLATPFGVASSRGVLGSALVGQKRYAEAEPVLVQACEAMRQQGDQMSKIGYYRSGVRDRVTSLVQLYEATGRPEKAEEWKKFLATLSDPAPPPPAPNQPE